MVKSTKKITRKKTRKTNTPKEELIEIALACLYGYALAPFAIIGLFLLFVIYELFKKVILGL